ncbi:MAG TPA: DUF1993 domain-containing protein [Candidatus Paceibacterota bacterium]|nr:DUF1993 domain-containing protein [Candidatus Paceibacterota bacterium]
MELYKITIPVFIRGLENTLTLIERAQRQAKKEKISWEKLFDGRLAPDMYNFKEQVGYVYFIALEAAGQLTGKKIPDFSYDETSFEELKTSLKRTIAFLKTIKEKDLKGAEKRKYTSHLMPKKKISAEKYISTAILPNFYFHVTTAYDILRHLSVPLTKEDYIGNL